MNNLINYENGLSILNRNSDLKYGSEILISQYFNQNFNLFDF